MILVALQPVIVRVKTSAGTAIWSRGRYGAAHSAYGQAARRRPSLPGRAPWLRTGGRRSYERPRGSADCGCERQQRESRAGGRARRQRLLARAGLEQASAIRWWCSAAMAARARRAGRKIAVEAAPSRATTRVASGPAAARRRLRACGMRLRRADRQSDRRREPAGSSDRTDGTGSRTGAMMNVASGRRVLGAGVRWSAGAARGGASAGVTAGAAGVAGSGAAGVATVSAV